MVLKTRKYFNAKYVNTKKDKLKKLSYKHYAPISNVHTLKNMKGGSGNSQPKINLEIVVKKCTKNLNEIYELANRLNRHRLVEKIIIILGGGSGYFTVFGKQIPRIKKGQKWFKYYGQIDELNKCLHDYFMGDLNFMAQMLKATKETSDFIVNKKIHGVRHEMRILLLLLYFLADKLNKIGLIPEFYTHLKKSLEHIESDTEQSKILRYIHTKLAILYFIKAHGYLNDSTNAEFVKNINEKKTINYANKQSTQTIINLIFGALEKYKYSEDKAELERLKAERKLFKETKDRWNEHTKLLKNLAAERNNLLNKKVKLENEQKEYFENPLSAHS